MRSIAEFTKTTLIDGILIVLPIYVSLLLLAEGLSAVARRGGSRALGRGEADHGRDPGLPRSFAKSWRSWRLPLCVSSPD